MGSKPIIDSVYDFSDKSLVELKAWLEPWFLGRPCDCECDCGDSCNYGESVRQTDDLVGHWDLNESSGLMLDTSGFSAANPADLELVSNGTAATRGVTGPLPEEFDTGAFEQNFAGTGALSAADYLRLPAAWASGAATGRFIFNGTLPFSAAAWVKVKADAGSFVGPIVGWLTAVSGTPPRENGWQLRVLWPDRTLRFIRCSFIAGVYAETVIDCPVPLVAGFWHHVACSYDGTTMRLYLDGVLVGSAASAVAPQSTNNQYIVTDGVVKPPAPASDYLGRVYGTQAHTSIWSAAVPLSTFQELLAGCGSSTSASRNVGYENGVFVVSGRPGINVEDGEHTEASLEDDADNEAMTISFDVTPGTIDHGALADLGADDHSQYHNDARGDARYVQLSDSDYVRDAGRWELVVSGSGPPVAATNEATDDFVYGWVSG